MVEIKEIAWERLSPEDREDNILGALIEIDLENADPGFSHELATARAKVADPADRMRLDIKMSDRIAQLRKEGKMLPIEKLKPKVKSMIDLKPEEARKALHSFAEELKQTGQK